MTRRGSRSGQGLVEFALIVPIFLVMLLVLVDFGRVIYAQNAITQNARGATRFASVSAPQADAAIRQRARLISPGVDVPDSAITGESGTFYPDGTGAGDGHRVVVEIVVAVPIITPIISTVVGGGFTVRARSEELIK